MKYLKKFNQASEYEAFKVGDEYITPNVSYVVDGAEVKFGPAVKPLVYNMVDLGLPSGTLWADRNVGAASPEDAGLYFTYGETVGCTAEQVVNGERVFEKEFYWDWNSDTQSYMKYPNADMFLQPEDDAATVNMGSEYRMPTDADFKELKSYTTRTVIDANNNEYTGDDIYNIDYGTLLKGVKIIGPNGNSIFIPFVGRTNHNYVDIFNDAYFHASGPTVDFFGDIIGHPYMINNDGGISHVPEAKFFGLSIRGVCNK